MAWPWVSRGRYEDMREQRDRLQAERDALLERAMAAPVAAAVTRLESPTQPASQDVDVDAIGAMVAKLEQAEAAAQTTAPVNFTTPFDRLNTRFGAAGRPDPKFRARAN